MWLERAAYRPNLPASLPGKETKQGHDDGMHVASADGVTPS